VGEIDAARVDVPAVLGVARQYQAVADIVESAARTHLTGLAFDGAAAGRAYVDRVDHIANQLRGWGRASVEIAATLRASADRYADADSHAARRLG
jgi:uncharacterized protein YukE